MDAPLGDPSHVPLAPTPPLRGNGAGCAATPANKCAWVLAGSEFLSDGDPDHVSLYPVYVGLQALPWRPPRAVKIEDGQHDLVYETDPTVLGHAARDAVPTCGPEGSPHAAAARVPIWSARAVGCHKVPQHAHNFALFEGPCWRT